ncbi:MAG: hypothetical protein QG602_2432 [Verrucomicrobiota bacterium]|nr:hypothetical protein [Verrucomicrobiota bacterium]
MGLSGPALCSAASAKAETTHVIFMGADLAAENDRVYHPVVDVTAASLVIRTGDKTVRLPIALTDNLRIIEELKLTETSVALDDLKAERAYSAETDPAAQLARTAALAAGQTAVVDLANAEVRRASLQVAGAGAMVAGAGNPEDAAAAARTMSAAQGAQAAAESTLNQALSTPNSQVYDVGAQSTRLTAEENYDAIRVSFAITPETDLAQPYFGLIALVRDPGNRTAQARKWVYMQPLGALGAGETRRVTVYRSGFPPGYELEGCEVHVYEGGRELATSLSRRRVEITEEEALSYRVFEYIGANKGRTLPAALVTTTLATEAWASVSKLQLEQTHHVRVAKDGSVTAAFGDAAGKKPVTDAALAAVLKSLRFNPALAAGKPVESIAPVVLGGLAVR